MLQNQILHGCMFISFISSIVLLTVLIFTMFCLIVDELNDKCNSSNLFVHTRTLGPCISLKIFDFEIRERY